MSAVTTKRTESGCVSYHGSSIVNASVPNFGENEYEFSFGVRFRNDAKLVVVGVSVVPEIAGCD